MIVNLLTGSVGSMESFMGFTYMGSALFGTEGS
ncbi:hypothetical protein DEU38_109190 [Rhodococcus sp. AG1013]|nr:hypothetical protein DEU38_109190 [Rhodococcus sp. AG1013]